MQIGYADPAIWRCIPVANSLVLLRRRQIGNRKYKNIKTAALFLDLLWVSYILHSDIDVVSCLTAGFAWTM
jgi:hypothetical protein